MSSDADARMQQWQQRRANRLAQLPWLHIDSSGGRPVRYAKGEVLVSAEHEQVARDAITAAGVPAQSIEAEPAGLGYVRLTAPGADVAAVVASVRAHGGDDAAGPNHVFVSTEGWEYGGPFGPPSAVDGFRMPTGPAAGATTRVTVVDTGIWKESPLPAAWYDAEPDDVAHSTQEHTDTGHANFITGVIMSRTDNARVRIIKVLDANGVCREHELAKALTTMADTDVVNLSLGGFTDGDKPPVMLAKALAAMLHKQDRVVVAAAGNEGLDRPYWPAAFAGSGHAFADQVIAVAAHDGTELCSWSNTGEWVSVAAPGSDIVSTYVTHDEFPSGFARWSGTSFAAPYVVGTIANSHAGAASVRAAADDVRKQAAAASYGGYPSLT
ncbi:MAG TPA: S8 family serine peptidase [Micromonosporaceae bacterium]